VKRDSDQRRQAGRLVRREKIIDEQGGIIELAIWQVPKSADYPEGIRYRCAYVPPEERRPSVLYDVHRRKAHHRHFEGTEYPYQFKSVDRLVSDFRADVERAKKARGI